MRLALVIPTLGPGGAERVLINLANRWALLGHEVFILTLSSIKSSSFYKIEEQINVINLDKLNSTSVNIFKRVFLIYCRILSVRNKIKEIQPHRILSFIDIMNLITILSTFGLKIPVVISERIDPHFHPINLIYKIIRILIYPFAFRLIMQTESAASYFPKSFQSFIRIIPNPVFQPLNVITNVANHAHRLVSVGRLDIQKDHVTLIKACAHLVYEHNKNIELIIYGEGDERFNLESLIEKLNLTSYVFLPGLVPDINEKLLKFDIFIFPSLYEGFPNALCEAMALGLPVVVSKSSGNIDVVQDGINGVMFSTKDSCSLAEKLNLLIDEPHLRLKFSNNAKLISVQFNSDKIFKLWDDVILN